MSMGTRWCHIREGADGASAGGWELAKIRKGESEVVHGIWVSLVSGRLEIVNMSR